MAGRLQGKVAFITGAARGQGRAHALALAGEGADIIGLDIVADIESVPYGLATDSELQSTVSAIEALDRRALFVQADVRSQAEIDAVVSRGLHEFGQIDILVANAGIYSQANFWEMTDEVWQDMIDINLTGVWRSAKAVAPHMIERQRGAMVLTSSVNGFRAGGNTAHYVAAKHGVIGLAKNFANELAPYGIRCNAICPGAVETRMIDNPHNHVILSGKADGTREEALESARHFHLLKGRSMLPPEAVSKGVLWLVGDDAEHVTGIALPVDAGHLALGGYNPWPT